MNVPSGYGARNLGKGGGGGREVGRWPDERDEKKNTVLDDNNVDIRKDECI